MLTMTTFINSFVCDWTTNYPWNLYIDNSIQCLSDTHIMYMSVGFLSLGLYYPLSTFMFPNFQFLDKTLDIKYDPSYMVIYVQV